MSREKNGHKCPMFPHVVVGFFAATIFEGFLLARAGVLKVCSGVLGPVRASGLGFEWWGRSEERARERGARNGDTYGVVIRTEGTGAGQGAGRDRAREVTEQPARSWLETSWGRGASGTARAQRAKCEGKAATLFSAEQAAERGRGGRGAAVVASDERAEKRSGRRTVDAVVSGRRVSESERSEHHCRDIPKGRCVGDAGGRGGVVGGAVRGWGRGGCWVGAAAPSSARRRGGCWVGRGGGIIEAGGRARAISKRAKGRRLRVGLALRDLVNGKLSTVRGASIVGQMWGSFRFGSRLILGGNSKHSRGTQGGITERGVITTVAICVPLMGNVLVVAVFCDVLRSGCRAASPSPVRLLG